MGKEVMEPLDPAEDDEVVGDDNDEKGDGKEDDESDAGSVEA